jgi:hypothetical protein
MDCRCPLATHDEFMDGGQETGPLPDEIAAPGEPLPFERRCQVWGERAQWDLIRSSDRRQQAIYKLDRIESVILTITAAYSTALIGLTAVSVWLNHPTYYLSSVAGSALAAVLGVIKIDIYKRRVLLLQQQEKSETSLRVLEAIGLIDDPTERMRIISEYAETTMQNLAAKGPARFAPSSVSNRRRSPRTRSLRLAPIFPPHTHLGM